MISDFRCTFDNAIGISPEITKDLKLSFPYAYMHADTMAKIAHAMKGSYRIVVQMRQINLGVELGI